jgi:hypothetical protein
MRTSGLPGGAPRRHPFAGPAWEKFYNEKLQDDTTWLVEHLAQDSVTALKRKKLIPAK